MRILIPSALVLWVGSTLLLSHVRWFARAPMVERLRPYALGGMSTSTRNGLLSVESFRDVVGPLARGIGERLARLLGVSEELATKLERIHSPLDVTAFRVRQVGWSLAGLGAGALLSFALQPPLVVALLLVLGGPLLAFMLLEQQVASASTAWQRRV